MTQVKLKVAEDNYSEPEQTGFYQIKGAVKDKPGEEVAICPFLLSIATQQQCFHCAEGPSSHLLISA